MKIREDDFLRDFLPTLRQHGSVIVPPGDDCAAIDLGLSDLLLAAVDQLAADTHYFGADSPQATPPELAGRKLLGRNLSDIAAMGGTARYAMTAVAMPPETPQERLDAFAGGLLELADHFEVSLIGGDLGSAPSEVSSLSVLGTVPRDEICLRKNARPGDKVFVTGLFGRSLASGHHLTFTPRLSEGRWLAAGRWTSCMIDVSDGLLKDLSRVCRASNVSATLDDDRIPARPGASKSDALLDGEDYELIIAIAPDKAQQLVKSWPFHTALTCIGVFAEGSGVRDTEATDLFAKYGTTFEHFETS